MEEFHSNLTTSVALHGHIKAVVSQLNEVIMNDPLTIDSNYLKDWREILKSSADENKSSVEAAIRDESLPMNFYVALNEIQQVLPKDTMIINEGSNTMDIGRTMLLNHFPRNRLDAGTFGTMGLGLGFSIAAALYCETLNLAKKVVCVQGDSAFGFSGLELETICRYKLPIIIVIMNNSGIGMGLDTDSYHATENVYTELPPTTLLPGANYHMVMQAFGGEGYLVTSPDELRNVLIQAIDNSKPCLINVVIDPYSSRKVQKHSWLTGLDSKL